MSDKQYYQRQKSENDKVGFEQKTGGINPETNNKQEENKNSGNKNQHYYRDHSRWPRKEHFERRSSAAETVDDVRADIKRIEKEIDLEIKDIKSLRL